VVESYNCERQHEGNECAHKAIRLSLLRYLKIMIAHVRLCRLIDKHGRLTRCSMTVLLQPGPGNFAILTAIPHRG
jgi:hypothetical protein